MSEVPQLSKWVDRPEFLLCFSNPRPVLKSLGSIPVSDRPSAFLVTDALTLWQIASGLRQGPQDFQFVVTAVRSH